MGTELRRLPSLITVAAGSSLYFAVPSEAPAVEIGLIFLIAAASFWVLSFLTGKKGWALRVGSGFLSAAAIGLFVGGGRPRWDAVLSSLLMVVVSGLYFGPPFSGSGKPGWTRITTAEAGPPARLSAAIDGYLLLSEAITYQFFVSSGTVITISLLLSVAGIISLSMSALGGAKLVDDSRKLARIIVFFSVLHIVSHRAQMPIIRILTAVVAGIFSIPSTI